MAKKTTKRNGRPRGRPPGKATPNWSPVRFRERLQAANMTQRDLADAMGVSVQTVSMWAMGDTSPHPHNLPKVAAALRCRQQDLLLVYKR